MLHTSVVKYGEDGDPVDTVRKTIADLPAYSFQLAGLPHLFYLRDLPKYLYSRFPRGLSFFCYLASVIVSYSAVSPWNIFRLRRTYSRGFPAELSLLVRTNRNSSIRGFLAVISFFALLNVGCTYYRGFPAENLYLRD